jgi:type I restriction enzyme S subunit
MTEPKRLVPKRRFKKFQHAGAWEERKLGEVVPIIMGQSPAGSTYSDTPSDFILVQGNADLLNGWVTPRVWTSQITKKAEAGDLIMSVRAPAGEMGKTAFDVVVGRGVAALKGNEFIFQCLIKMNEEGYWKKLTTGSTFESLNSDVIKNAGILIPNLKEQEEIGSFFKQLDNLITIQQLKIEKTKALKAAYLSEMFPAQGERQPKRRFAGFTGDWEERKLGEIVDVRSGRDYKHLSEGEIPVYGTGGYMLSVNEALSYQEDAIGIGRKGTIDKPYILKAPFWTVDTLFYTVPRKTYDLNFVFGIFQNIDWKKRDESTGVPSLSKTTINSIELRTPDYPEQKMIGNYLTNLDNLISLHQSKLDKLQQLKKAYLNEMFV